MRRICHGLAPESIDKSALLKCVFQHNAVAYMASAGSAALNAITTASVRSKAEHSRADTLFLRACRQAAIGSNNHILRIRDPLPIFQGFYIERLPGSGTRGPQVYYTRRRLGDLQPRITVAEQVDLKAWTIIRLAIADRDHEVPYLSLITGRQSKALRDRGAGKLS